MKSLRRGSGTDVAGSRPYRPGDDMDSIDWAASARLSTARGADEFVVRERFAEEAPKVVIVCDRRPEMACYGPSLPWLDKPAAMRTIVELVLASAGAAGGFVGYLDYADGDPHWRQPKGERKLIEIRDERLWSSEYGGPPDWLERSIDHLASHPRAVTPGTFVFVISDFLPVPPTELWLAAAEHRWDIVPVVIQDPTWEQSFPDVSGIVGPIARCTDRSAGCGSAPREGGCEAKGSQPRAPGDDSRDLPATRHRPGRRLLERPLRDPLDAPRVVRSAPYQARDRGLTRWDDVDFRRSAWRPSWCLFRLLSCSPRWLGTTARPSSLERRRRPRSRPRRPSHHARCCSETPSARPSTSCSTRSASIPDPFASQPTSLRGRSSDARSDASPPRTSRRTSVGRSSFAASAGPARRPDSPGCMSSREGRVSFTRRGDRLDRELDSRAPARGARLLAAHGRRPCRRFEAVGALAGGSPLASRTVVSSRSGHARPSAPAGRPRRDGRGRRTRVRGLAAGGSRSTSGACALASARTGAESPRAGARPPRERRSGRRRRRSAPRARARRRGVGARGVGRPRTCASGTGVGLVGGRSAGPTRPRSSLLAFGLCSTRRTRLTEMETAMRPRLLRRRSGHASGVDSHDARAFPRAVLSDSHPATGSRRHRHHAREPCGVVEQGSRDRRARAASNR